MADDEVVKLVGNLNDLNSVSYKAGLEFRGLTKRLIVMSDSVSGAGKKWTIFARLVSGSPLWRLQNKVRAFVDSLALMEEASRKNTEAQKAADEQVINLVKSQRMLTKVEEEGANAGKTQVKIIQEQLKLLKHHLDYQEQYGDSISNNLLIEKRIEELMNEANTERREAIQNTVAFNKALLLGKSDLEAYAEGMEELIAKADQMQETFEDAQKAAKLAENLKIRDMSDPKEAKKRKEGVKAAREQFGSFFSKEKGTEQKEFIEMLAERKKDEKSFGGKALFFLQKKRQQMFNFTVKYQKFMLGVGKMARPVLNYAFKVMIMIMLGIVAFLAFAKIAYEAFGFLQEFGVFEDLKRIGMLVLDTAKNIIGLIMAVVSGDVYKFIEHGEKIVKNIIAIGILAVAAILKTLFALAVGAFYSIIDFIEKLKDDKDLRNKVFEIIMKAGVLLLAAYFIKYLAIKLMEIAAIYALPVLIGVLLIAGITALLYKIVKDFKIGRVFEGAKKLGGKVKSFVKDKIIPRATGGIVGSGETTLVGERGPELVKLPAGSRVHTNDASKKMAGHTINNTFNITVHGGLSNVPKLAEQLGKEIGNKITRRISSSGLFR
tara:strand:- start:5996 stop:7804 length:1809 start_codon:yes stop_codon:yes gene_type:complete